MEEVEKKAKMGDIMQRVGKIIKYTIILSISLILYKVRIEALSSRNIEELFYLRRQKTCFLLMFLMPFNKGLKTKKKGLEKLYSVVIAISIFMKKYRI